MTPTVTESADRLQDPVEKLAREAHEAVDRVASKLDPAIEEVRSAAAHAGDVVGARLEDLAARQDEWTESMRLQVRAHPLTVVGIAALAGLLLGRIMR
jgi:ElaB/YqjD/DUF883 family membrane-anchored ribosome-binding protein